MPQKRCLLLFVIIFIFSFAPAVLAAPLDDVTMEVQSGFDHEAKIGSWAPISIILENQGRENIEGIIILKNASRPPTHYNRAVVLAPGAKKKVDFFVPISHDMPTTTAGVASKGLTAAFQSGGQEITKEINLYVSLPNSLVTAVLAADRTTLNHLALIDLPDADSRFPQEHRVVHLSLDELPPYRQVLSNFSVIALNNINTGRINPNQLAALEQWLMEGGTLVIGGGPNWQQVFSGLPQRLLPVEEPQTVMVENIPELAQFAQTSLSFEQPAAAAKARLSAGAKELIAAEGFPLAAKKDIGQGQVIFFALDLGLQPVASWSGNKTLWEQLLLGEIYASQLNNGWPKPIPAGTINYNFISALQRLSALEIPGVAWVFLVIIVYLLLIGVVNYLVLKKFDRRDWAWATIPLLVVLFTSGIYLSGARGRGDIISNNVAVITLAEDENSQPWGRFYSGIFAPNRASYELNIPRYVLPAAEDRYYGRPQGDSSMRISWQGGGTDVRFENMAVWSMRSVMYEEAVSEIGKIDSRVSVVDGDIKGTIVNNTGLRLEEAAIFTAQGDVVELGDLAPGQEASYTLTLSSVGRRGPDVAFDLGQKMWGPSGGTNSDADRKREQRREVVQGILGYEGFMKAAPLNFLAWNEEPLRELSINGRQPEQRRDLNAFIAPLSINGMEGSYQLPPGLVMGELYNFRGRGMNFDPQGIRFSNGDIYYRLDLPVALEARAASGTLYIQGEPELFSHVAVYNIETGDWDKLGSGADTIQLPDLSAYVEGNTIRVKVDNPTGRDSFFQGVTISVNGGDDRND